LGENELIDVRRAVGNLEAKQRADKSAAKRDAGDEGRSHHKKGRQGRVKNRRVPKKVPPQKAGVKKRSSKGKR
jgi:hypothetical protein